MEGEKKRRGRKPKGEEPPLPEDEPQEKKKRGRKHKPRVYKVTQLDDTITLFSETSPTPLPPTDVAPKQEPPHHHLKVVNQEPSIIHLPLKGLETQPDDRVKPQIDYKKKIILPEEGDRPMTEKEYKESIHKREKETNGLEKYIDLNGKGVEKKYAHTHTHASTDGTPPLATTYSSRLETVLQFLEDPSVSTEDLRKVFYKIKTNLDLDAFLTSNDFKNDIEPNPSFETALDDTVRQAVYNYTPAQETDNRRCWWCTYAIPADTIPFPLPTHYNQSTKKFKTKGYFCSPNCAMAYNNDNGNAGDNYLIIFFVRMQYDPESNISVRNLVPAPHWRLLEDYGGTLGIEAFRESFFNHTTFELLEYPMISHHILVEKTTVPKTQGGELRLKRTKPPPLTRVQQTF